MLNSFITPNVQIATKHTRNSEITPLRHIILIPNQRYVLLLLLATVLLSVLRRFIDSDWIFVSSNSAVLLLIEAALLSGQATNTNFIVFELTRPGFELEAITLIITPQMWLYKCTRK